ncbi:MAG: alpha/beta fold hydrolase [Aestuariivirgaceae bacterium]
MPAINIKGSRLSFGAAGSGPTVVALHSSASTGVQWNSLSEHLMNRHCVFTPDLAGYGGSDAWPGGPEASLTNEAEFVFGLIEAWEEPVHLVGHSFGGAVALQIALSHPEWVRSLTLIEPTVFHLLRDGDEADRQLHTTMQSVRGVVNAAAALGNPNAGMKHFIDFWNGEGAWENTSPRLRSHFTNQIGQVINNFAAGEAESWSIEDCRKLTCPTMTMMGLDSPAPSQRTTEMLAETIPGARLHMIPGAGHMVPLTDPHIVDPLISGHIRVAESTEKASQPAWHLQLAA